MTATHLLIGLGNPGGTYAGTRHNVGFLSLDWIAGELQGSFRKAFFRPYLYCPVRYHTTFLILAKPLTYMNRSGEAAVRLLRRYHIAPSRMIVLCDTMDLPAGTVRIKRGGSTAGHRGIASLISEVGSSDFPRVYIGIGRPAPDNTVVAHVLGVPNDTESGFIHQGIAAAGQAALKLTSGSLEQVMHEYNRKRPILKGAEEDS